MKETTSLMCDKKKTNAQWNQKRVEAGVMKNLGALRPGHDPSAHQIRALIAAQENIHVSPKISKWSC